MSSSSAGAEFVSSSKPTSEVTAAADFTCGSSASSAELSMTEPFVMVFDSARVASGSAFVVATLSTKAVCSGLGSSGIGGSSSEKVEGNSFSSAVSCCSVVGTNESGVSSGVSVNDSSKSLILSGT